VVWFVLCFTHVGPGQGAAKSVHGEELFARRLLRLAAEVVELVVAIEVVLVGAAIELHALEQLFLDVRRTSDGAEGGQPVFVRDDAIEGLALEE